MITISANPRSRMHCSHCCGGVAALDGSSRASVLASDKRGGGGRKDRQGESGDSGKLRDHDVFAEDLLSMYRSSSL